MFGLLFIFVVFTIVVGIFIVVVSELIELIVVSVVSGIGDLR